MTVLIASMKTSDQFSERITGSSLSIDGAEGIFISATFGTNNLVIPHKAKQSESVAVLEAR